MLPISQQPHGAPAQNTDDFLIARAGNNYRLTLSDIIGDEEASRIAADDALAADIVTEQNTRSAADTVLTNAIIAETAARIAADASKLSSSALDTDDTLNANSDSLIASQKAVKTYIDTRTGTATETTAGMLEVATDAEVLAGSLDDKIITPLKLKSILPVSAGSGANSIININSLNTASGNYSVALGGDAEASGDTSFAYGFGVLASGNYSFVGGYSDSTLEAAGNYSFAWHYNNTAYGPIPSSQVGQYGVLLGGLNSTTTGTAGSLLACSQVSLSGQYSTAINRQTESLTQSYTLFARTLNLNGGIQKQGIVTTTALTYTVTYQNNIIVANSASNNVTLTLPASPVTGQELEVIRTSASNVVTLDGNGKNINGAGTKVVTASAYAKVRITYSGSEWLIMDEI